METTDLYMRRMKDYVIARYPKESVNVLMHRKRGYMSGGRFTCI